MCLYACLIVCQFCCVVGTLTCSRVTKVSVCPRALLALRERMQAFGLETGHAFFREACQQTLNATEGKIQVSTDVQSFPCVRFLSIYKHYTLQASRSHCCIYYHLMSLLTHQESWQGWLWHSSIVPQKMWECKQYPINTSTNHLSYTGKCSGWSSDTSLQKNCSRYGRLLEATSP